jgi:hypothetical protein
VARAPVGGRAVASAAARAPASCSATPCVQARARARPHAHARTRLRAPRANQVRAVVAREGLRGLYAGYGAFLLRDLPFDAVEFVAYEQLRRAAARLLQRDPSPVEVSLVGAAAGGFTGGRNGGGGARVRVCACARVCACTHCTGVCGTSLSRRHATPRHATQRHTRQQRHRHARHTHTHTHTRTQQAS